MKIIIAKINDSIPINDWPNMFLDMSQNKVGLTTLIKNKCY